MSSCEYTVTLLRHILSRRSFLLTGEDNISAFESKIPLPCPSADEPARLSHLEELFRAEMIDELRHAAYSMGMNTSQVDFVTVSLLLDEAAANSRFVCELEPNTENLVDSIMSGRDETCEWLLRRGAQLPIDSRTLLLTLFATRNMHRTVSYLIDNRMLPMHMMSLRHLEAAVDSPYVALARILASRPLIEMQFKALPIATKRDYNLRFFYWHTRAVVLGDIGAEQLRLLARHFDLSLFNEETFLAMLRQFGDCWEELGDKQIKKIQSDDDNSFAPFRALRQLVLSCEDQPMKGRYAQFYTLAKVILGAAYRGDSEKLIGLLSLDMSLECTEPNTLWEQSHFDLWHNLIESSAA